MGFLNPCGMMKISKMELLLLSLLLVQQVSGQDFVLDPVREITFDDIFRGRVFAETDVSGLRSMNNGEYFTVLNGNTILKYSYRTGEFTDILFRIDQLGRSEGGSLEEYEFSADDRKILVAIDKERIYRHSFRADYYMVDLSDGSVTYLSRAGKQQLASFSPDGRKVAFVRENNLYVFDLEQGLERQLTFDGEHNRIINGAPDWVYEEEFAFSKGYAWSPDSRSIAYYRTDESRVRLFNMTSYGDLYPEWYSYKYPKAGEKNSLVSIRVVDLQNGRDIEMDTGEETDQYIPRIKWTGRPGELCILRLNRLQNKLDILLADAGTGKSRVILEERNDYYIREATDETVIFLGDMEHFLYQSEKSGYHHFYLYDMEGREIGPVTSGDWDIIDFLGFDEVGELLYYTSYEDSPLHSDVWSIRLDGSGKKKISFSPGWNTAEFSKTFDYYIHTHSSTSSPKYITLHDSKGVMIRVLEDNADLKQTAEAFGIPEKELFTIESPDGIVLNAYMYKPKGFREDGKYPLLMFVYGGPDSQQVRDEWGTDAWHYLLLEKGYVIVCVDNRGTDGRGEAFRKATYMQLGRLEVEDQIGAAKYLGSLPWIDESRIGVWGSSYGGYMSCLCMTLGSDVFKLGIALYSVTNWRYYDTIYTERFMRTPKENPEGYELGSPIQYADRLKGYFLLVHGMSDDNVHFQHSVEFAEALIQAGRPFEMAFYPNQGHGARQQAGIHLREKMTSFVEKNL